MIFSIYFDLETNRTHGYYDTSLFNVLVPSISYLVYIASTYSLDSLDVLYIYMFWSVSKPISIKNYQGFVIILRFFVILKLIKLSNN